MPCCRKLMIKILAIFLNKVIFKKTLESIYFFRFYFKTAF